MAAAVVVACVIITSPSIMRVDATQRVDLNKRLESRWSGWIWRYVCHRRPRRQLAPAAARPRVTLVEVGSSPASAREKIWNKKILRNFENEGHEKKCAFWGSHRFFHSFSVHTDASKSRQELSNEYLIAKFGIDTVENEPSKVWGMDNRFQIPDFRSQPLWDRHFQTLCTQ